MFSGFESHQKSWKNEVEPKKFKVILAPAAQRDLKRFQAQAAVQLVKDINSYLETSPLGYRKTRIKKLKGFEPPLYRLRSGEYRAYYRIVAYKVIILAITHKKDSEKLLKTFK